jgi:hypothetical protein
MKRVLREPLLHFFLLGAGLFALYGWLHREGFNAPNEIVVSRGQVAVLQQQFERVWQRPPTRDELQGLIDNWVREEIFYREGLAMGLDRDDPIVRRRVGQKVQFIVDSAAPAEPSTEELQRWLDEHVDKYRTEASYSLQQVYFDPARHADHLRSDIEAARRALTRGKVVAGDSTLLPANLQGDASEIVRTFGSDFEAALGRLPVGDWQGPVQSGFGWHLVKLSSREAARPATLAEVRAAVERDLMQARTEAANTAYYERLRSNYVVRIEDGGPPSAEPAS